MAVPFRRLFHTTRTAGLDQFQPRVFILATVTHITDTLALVGIWPNALHIHAQQPRIEIHAPIKITDQHHAMPDPIRDVIDGFFAGHFSRHYERKSEILKLSTPNARRLA